MAKVENMRETKTMILKKWPFYYGGLSIRGALLFFWSVFSKVLHRKIRRSFVQKSCSKIIRSALLLGGFSRSALLLREFFCLLQQKNLWDIFKKRKRKMGENFKVLEKEKNKKTEAPGMENWLGPPEKKSRKFRMKNK
ncbi:Protein CBG26734 [Caenorhabditis briggsae]|uniref:Protein CBG26734 n=1 Tax=Caenorhabditis briggsae TaxID=6238 RepID=B6IEA9_CAEBR|nr:Protein CBG26734 [Caenorhabditis briggsae]CAS01173.1 Protein CBG26734 [Caenorhabditis briggsae]